MLRRLLLLSGISLFAASSALAQSTLSGDAAVVSEWKGQDRGDGSGSYELTTTLKSGLIEMVHALTAERNVEQEVTTTEHIRVLENGFEKGRAESDPTGLGPWATAFTSYVVPFGVDLSGAPRSNYRPSDGRVKDIVHSVVPDAKVSSRRASDGRTTAEVEITGTLPADELADKFLAIRQAFREAEVGLARLRIRGTASAPAPVTE
jgi:hypothetical protein